MEEEYNWDLIAKVSAPIALAEAFVFYTNISDGWKWVSIASGLFLAGLLVYINDKKKANIFTAIAIVFLAALVVRFLKNFGVF